MVLDEIASPAARKFGLLNPTTKDIRCHDFARDPDGYRGTEANS